MPTMLAFKGIFSAFLLSQTFIHTVQALLSTGAIFPLYIYPQDSSCSPWSTLFASYVSAIIFLILLNSFVQRITANPTLPFYAIINPANGPGSGSVPDTNYQACIPKLLAQGSNVKVLGYVATGNGKRSSSAVLSDIAKYMNWPTSYRPSGIFFDETSAKTKFLSTYTTYANQVRQDVPSGSIVILNPGTTVSDTGYFSIADYIVTTENFYNSFSYPSSLVINASEPASQQTVLLYNGPSTLPTTLIDQMVAGGIASIFITNMLEASAYNTTPSYWGAFCAELTRSQS
jgi:hypothetical protein